MFFSGNNNSPTIYIENNECICEVNFQIQRCNVYFMINFSNNVCYLVTLLRVWFNIHLFDVELYFRKLEVFRLSSTRNTIQIERHFTSALFFFPPIVSPSYGCLGTSNDSMPKFIIILDENKVLILSGGKKW